MADDTGPGAFDFTVYRGDSYWWEHAFTDDTGAPIDITEWVFEAQYRATPDAADALAEDAFDLVDGPGGVVRRTLTATESAKLTAGTVAWDMQATKTDGTVKTYLASPAVLVTGDVSR